MLCPTTTRHMRLVHSKVELLARTLRAHHLRHPQYKNRLWVVRPLRLLRDPIRPMGIAALVMEKLSAATGLREHAALCTGYTALPACWFDPRRLADIILQFCGNTSAHCGEGCQSGPCVGAPVAPAPGPSPAPAAVNPGAFNIVGQSGVPAMHAGLMENGRVVFLDKVENYTQIKLGDGQYAYSAEYDPATNTVAGLAYKVRKSPFLDVNCAQFFGRSLILQIN